MLHYVSVSGASVEALDAYLHETTAERVDASRIVRSTDDGCIIAMRVSDSTPQLLQEAGARTVNISVTPESTRVVARAVRDIDVRTLLDVFRDVHGDPALDAKREVERDHYTDEAFRADVADRLTERQDAALSAAYFGGYFDWPRDSTAEEVAESLDISSATLHQHLRHAQHKLLEVYFDDTAARTRS
jgi:predicted DNA binding protein